MRLYVRCRHCSFRTYLSLVFNSRNELARHFGSHYFIINCSHCGISETYSVNDVFAEGGASAIAAGAIIGGIVGALVLGPIGLLLGGGAGATLGSGGDAQERERANRFNREVL